MKKRIEINTDQKYGFWIWKSNFIKRHRDNAFDQPLCSAIADLLLLEKESDPFTVVDFGCGGGQYVRFLKSRGIQCDGFDGNPNTEVVTDGLCKVANLATPMNLPHYNWVISLEVAEHIPPQHEKVYVENVINHATDGIIISWAPPGQPGTGHVNCKRLSRVIRLFTSKNLLFDQEATDLLRASASADHFKKSVLVFRC